MSQRIRGEGNLPLSQLDLNQVQNVSHIPQMSSALKRASGRASGRQSMIGAPRTNLSQQTQKRSSTTGISEMVQQSTLRSGRRKSLASSNSVSRPTHRASSFGLGNMGSYLSQSKDPRPLRDKNFQQTMQQEVYDYLLSNNFELEMKHPLSTKSLKSPTQKDFVMIFQFLYKKADPGYRFTKSIEHEVYYVLKGIKYPYLESINKSQISAVGGQNWHVFLGILHWLVQLLGKIESVTAIYTSKDYDVSENSDVEGEKIFVNYIIQSYNAFLNNIDDYSNFFNEMESEYEAFTRDIVIQTHQLQQENLTFREQYQKLVTEAESLNAIEKKSEALESDLFKFKAYIESMENRKQKWSSVLEQIKREMVNSEAELEKTEEEKSKIQKQISDQGLTPKDIDRMNNERDRVSKSIDAVNLRLNELSKIVHSKEHAAQQSYESLMNTVKEYNYNVYSIASTSTDIEPSKYVVKLDNLLSEERLGLRPDALLDGQDLKTIRTNIQELKNQISSKIHQAQDEGINYQDKVDSLTESIAEKAETIESLEAKLSASKLDYEELYETMNKDATSYHTEIERLENELKNMQSESRQHLLLLEQHSKTIDMEYNKLLSHIQHEREILHAKVQQMIESVISLKINVQNSLDDLDLMTLNVLEKERAENVSA